MKIVVALGGNALLRRGEPVEAEVQRAHVRDAAASLATLARGHTVVITHGNGPQVGLLALQAEAYHPVRAFPLDVLGAESEGMIGYLLEQELRGRMPGREIATLLTQVQVDANDPAFGAPTKPIGPVYSEEEAQRLAAERGWTVAPDGAKWRRVVPSPEPRRILEIGAIRTLVEAGVTVVCTGGGGIPVIVENNVVFGAEAVIDKDRSAALLAWLLGADMLVLLTDVEAVVEGYRTPSAHPLHETTPKQLRQLRLDLGSMGPKVDAACRFVEQTGRVAAIGALEEAAAIVRGEAGTIVRPDPEDFTFRHGAGAGV
ncbi:MAG: carbamate kinase [Polyangiaceae bacterium]